MSRTRKEPSTLLGPWRLFTVVSKKVQELNIFLNGTKEDKNSDSDPMYPDVATGNGYNYSLLPISWKGCSGRIHEEPHQSIRNILGDFATAREVLSKYIKMYGVNISNRYGTTLLHHLTYSGYGMLMGQVLAHPDFTAINYRCTSWPLQTNDGKLQRLSNSNNLNGVLHASALDMAIEYWLEGDHDLNRIELLLQYGAIPPSQEKSFVYDGQKFGDTVLREIGANYRGKKRHSQDELVALFCLLARYGWDPRKEFMAMNSKFMRDMSKLQNVPKNYINAYEEFVAIQRLVYKATKNLKPGELLVEMTTERSHTFKPNPLIETLERMEAPGAECLIM